MGGGVKKGGCEKGGGAVPVVDPRSDPEVRDAHPPYAEEFRGQEIDFPNTG